MNMKRASGIGLATALLLTTAAQAKDWKTVVIGMEGAYEPYNLTDPSGKIVGFEPDLVNDVCGRMKVECKIIAQDWDGMIPGLNAGKFDVIMDGMSITDERKKTIDFSKPYSQVPAAFAAAKASPLAKLPGLGKSYSLVKEEADAGKVIEEMKALLKGKVIGVQVSTTNAGFVEKYFKGIAEIRDYKTTEQHDLDPVSYTHLTLPTILRV